MFVTPQTTRCTITLRYWSRGSIDGMAGELLEEIRRRIVIAMVSDDKLMNLLVLKGGNALSIVHEVGERASLDMDYSIEATFPDEANARDRIFRALQREFTSIGYVVFDETFVLKPSKPSANRPEWWGGYFVEFKLAERSVFEKHKDDLDALRRNAAVVGPSQQRKYGIDISKNEFCAGKVKKDLDGYTVYVYSLEMIAVEKLRAICQQMPEYTVTNIKKPRARDFYDIHEIVKSPNVNLTVATHRELFEGIFGAKGVPLAMLGDIHKHRSFHAPDWPAVKASIKHGKEDFEYYFQFVVDYVSGLKALWEK